MEDDDLILDWIIENEQREIEAVGYHTIRYTEGVWIVLRSKAGCKPKYVGWFAVSEMELNNPQFDFLFQKEGKWVYRAKCDKLPEEKS